MWCSKRVSEKHISPLSLPLHRNHWSEKMYETTTQGLGHCCDNSPLRTLAHAVHSLHFVVYHSIDHMLSMLAYHTHQLSFQMKYSHSGFMIGYAAFTRKEVVDLCTITLNDYSIHTCIILAWVSSDRSSPNTPSTWSKTFLTNNWWHGIITGGHKLDWFDVNTRNIWPKLVFDLMKWMTCVHFCDSFYLSEHLCIVD